MRTISALATLLFSTSALAQTPSLDGNWMALSEGCADGKPYLNGEEATDFEKSDQIKVIYNFAKGDVTISILVQNTGTEIDGCVATINGKYSVDPQASQIAGKLEKFSATCEAFKQGDFLTNPEVSQIVKFSADGNTLSLLGQPETGKCEPGVLEEAKLKRIQ